MKWRKNEEERNNNNERMQCVHGRGAGGGEGDRVIHVVIVVGIIIPTSSFVVGRRVIISQNKNK